MFLPRFLCLGGLLALTVEGIHLPGAKQRFAARQYDYSFSFPLPPTGTGIVTTGISPSRSSTGVPSGTAPGPIGTIGTTSAPYGNSTLSYSAFSTGGLSTGGFTGTDPGGPIIPVGPTSAPSTNVSLSYGPLSTGALSGSAPGTISQAGTTKAPYGNSSSSTIGTGYSTGSLIYTSSDPKATSANSTSIGSISGYPTPSSNATSASYGTISATPVSKANSTDPGYPYPTHGPYPFPSSKRGTVGSGISQSATSIANLTSAPTDPSASRFYPTHGPYPFPSSKISYSASSVVGTIGTTVSYSSGPSASPSISVNATSIPPLSGSAPISTGATSISDPSASPSISVNATTIPPLSGSGISYPTGGTGTGTGTGLSFSITATPTIVDPIFSTFSYAPTVKSQASEYYYHHRRPHHGKEHYGEGEYEYDTGDDRAFK